MLISNPVQVVQRLTSIVNFWGERKVFSPETVAALMSAVTSPGPASSLAAPAPAPAAVQVGISNGHLQLTRPQVERVLSLLTHHP